MTRLLLFGVGAGWAACVLAGFVHLLNYANTAGDGHPAPARWPGDVSLASEPATAHLLVFAHPHCPCTRASIAELERLVTRLQGLLTVHVLFYRPAGFPAGWERTDLWHRAAAMPGVGALPDDAGVLARRFGATTSGTTLLYDADGRLLFHGGITNARGHAGPSIGSAAIVSLVTESAPASTPVQTRTPVFGCPLECSPQRDIEGEAPCREQRTNR